MALFLSVSRAASCDIGIATIYVHNLGGGPGTTHRLNAHRLSSRVPMNDRPAGRPDGRPCRPRPLRQTIAQWDRTQLRFARRRAFWLADVGNQYHNPMTYRPLYSKVVCAVPWSKKASPEDAPSRGLGSFSISTARREPAADAATAGSHARADAAACSWIH